MYDPRCFDLAEYFLPDDAPECRKLAQVIQDAIENYLPAHHLTKGASDEQPV